MARRQAGKGRLQEREDLAVGNGVRQRYLCAGFKRSHYRRMRDEPSGPSGDVWAHFHEGC